MEIKKSVYVIVCCKREKKIIWVLRCLHCKLTDSSRVEGLSAVVSPSTHTTAEHKHCMHFEEKKPECLCSKSKNQTRTEGIRDLLTAEENDIIKPLYFFMMETLSILKKKCGQLYEYSEIKHHVRNKPPSAAPMEHIFLL